MVTYNRNGKIKNTGSVNPPFFDLNGSKASAGDKRGARQASPVKPADVGNTFQDHFDILVQSYVVFFGSLSQLDRFSC